MERSIQDMSSQELLELAKLRRIEEAKAARLEYKEELNGLRQERRELIKKHSKTINTIDNRIKKIRERMSPTGTVPSDTPTTRGNNISAAVLTTLENNGDMDTKQLKEHLGESNLNTANLSQTLAYLKRQGKVVSPARAVYKLA